MLWRSRKYSRVRYVGDLHNNIQHWVGCGCSTLLAIRVDSNKITSSYLESYGSDNVVQETKKNRQIMSSRSLSLELAKHKHRLAAQLVNTSRLFKLTSSIYLLHHNQFIHSYIAGEFFVSVIFTYINKHTQPHTYTYNENHTRFCNTSL